MKFTTYLRDGAPRLALVDGNDLIDLNDAQPKVPADLRAALKAGVSLQAAGQAALKDKAPRQPLAGAKFAPPVPEPGKIICLGLNYYDHAKEGGREKPDYPWFFFRAASSLVFASCITCPFNSERMRRSLAPGGSSSAVTTTGPKPPVASKFLPMVHCGVRFW